jgi:hypothetical protein
VLLNIAVEGNEDAGAAHRGRLTLDLGSHRVPCVEVVDDA